MGEKKLKIFAGLLLIALIIIFIICYFYENKKDTSADYVQIDTKGTALEVEYNDEVQLVLDNASITSNQTAPINGIEADKLTITLADNSTNTITDCESYTTFTDTEKSESDGAIFTKTEIQKQMEYKQKLY